MEILEGEENSQAGAQGLGAQARSEGLSPGLSPGRRAPGERSRFYILCSMPHPSRAYY